MSRLRAMVTNDDGIESEGLHHLARVGAEAGFEVGTRTSVDVLNVQTNLRRAETTYARSRYDYIINTLRLKQASGSLSVEDVRVVDGWLEAPEKN